MFFKSVGVINSWPISSEWRQELLFHILFYILISQHSERKQRWFNRQHCEHMGGTAAASTANLVAPQKTRPICNCSARPPAFASQSNALWLRTRLTGCSSTDEGAWTTIKSIWKALQSSFCSEFGFRCRLCSTIARMLRWTYLPVVSF